MQFHPIRLKIISVSRYLVIGLLIVLLFFYSSDQGLHTLDSIGQWYIEKNDKKWKALSVEGTAKAWKEFQTLGNISRHHRYAPFKTTLWFSLVRNASVVKNNLSLQKSLVKWAKKNGRNLMMQAELINFYRANNKKNQAESLLLELSYRFPEYPQLLVDAVQTLIDQNKLTEAKALYSLHLSRLRLLDEQTKLDKNIATSLEHIRFKLDQELTNKNIVHSRLHTNKALERYLE